MANFELSCECGWKTITNGAYDPKYCPDCSRTVVKTIASEAVADNEVDTDETGIPKVIPETPPKPKRKKWPF